MASVTLKNVVKKYGDVAVVKNIDLDIEDHEFVALVGPSGCGKTTTLRMVAGLEEITNGSVSIGDRVVNDLPPKDRDIAMVFQNYALYPHMTVYDNMAFALKLSGRPKDEIDRRIDYAVKILELEPFLKRKPNELSGGQRQRVALGRAIVREPQVFLMDEPLSNLDAKLRVQMRLEISRLHQRLRTTTIYVTHDQIEAMTMADKIVVMKDGVIQQVDTAKRVYDYPVNKFVAGFIGSPSMNFLDGTLQEHDGRLIFAGTGYQLAVSPQHRKTLLATSEQEITLGIRPDQISIGEDAQDSGNRLNALVDVVEPLGSEQLVYLNIGNNANLIAQLDPTREVKPGDRVALKVNMQAAHYFSKATEAAIGGD